MDNFDEDHLDYHESVEGYFFLKINYLILLIMVRFLLVGLFQTLQKKLDMSCPKE